MVAMRRFGLDNVTAAIILIVAGLVVAVSVWWLPPPGQFVVQGRVTGSEGKPVSGIEVWLNAWPRATVASGGRGQVTVVGSATTSATGSYAFRIRSLSALAPDVINGRVRFSVETGNGTGLGLVSFSRSLSGGTTTVVLRLSRSV